MKYELLLWPHTNARYQAETRALACAELRLMLDAAMPGASIEIDDASAMPALVIDAPGPLNGAALRAFERHSLTYGLFEARPDGSLVPLNGRERAYLGGDLPFILKYKGKTNELFLQLVINAALYAGDYWNEEGPLNLLDPMCGRGTAPFIALNRGWNAVGSDVDRADLKEAERFFKRYLEYHRFKHEARAESRTLKGGGSAQVQRFEVADTPEHFKQKSGVTLSLALVDATRLSEALPRDSFHLVACDLPYGVKHDAQPGRDAPTGKNWLETLLRRSLTELYQVMKPGAAIALSFNAQTFPLKRLRGLMAEAGFEVMEGGPYDAFEHWVEQAITRDIAVARKPARR